MKITKAVVTAAGPGQSSLPLQHLVDRDGVEKTALEMIIEEIDAAGIDSIAIVLSPGSEDAYREAAGKLVDRLTFVVQQEARGYGQALLCARDYVGDEPFLHLVGDHLYLSRNEKKCAQHLVQVASKYECTVSAVQGTREHMLPYFGTVGGLRVAQETDLYEVKRVIEKPTPTLAEQELTIAGFRSGTYLCFFGMHVLTATVLDILEQLVASRTGSVPLADALQELASRQRYLACEVNGQRYNIGIKYGLLNAQLALGLAGVDRDRILTQLVELLSVQR
ncbi:MAG: sugar phosphate nucleotidyltransferase [Pirellula sp.]|jgi:UTP--glucose-1-phosphate uridylyltransferase|nr:sugar phosphate nucleotidyltransferase [Pirellula sp.]